MRKFVKEISLYGLFLLLIVNYIQGHVVQQKSLDIDIPQRCFPEICNPDNVHFSIVNSTAMTFSWQTLYKTNTSTVQYGLTEALQSSAVGDSSSYQASLSNQSTFYNNDVVVTNLQPSTRYYYRVGDSEGGWSSISYFYTPANYTGDLPGPNSTLLVYADMGIDLGQKVISRLHNLIPPSNSTDTVFDFVLHIGDMSYANDFPSDMYEDIWNAWFETLELLMSVRPYMVAPGNHEYHCGQESCYPQTQNFTAYNARFKMPSFASGGATGHGRNMWYSFNYGNVHYVVIDTETDFPGAPEGTEMFGDQLAWLKQDLQNANQNRHLQPWLVVAGHRPIYSSSIYYYDGATNSPKSDALILAQAMEQLFLDNKIDLFLNGHVHSYERSYPMISSTNFTTSYNNPGAPVYVTSGAAGCTQGLSYTWVYPQPAWSVTRTGLLYGYGILDFYDDVNTQQHAAHWRFIRADNNEVFDEFLLTKDFVQ
jgi:hypothetical protein